jgi:hypothetical protein
MGNGSTQLLSATSKHCAAFFHAWNFGKIAFRDKGEDYILEQGTLTFIEYDGEYYAITNQHVLGENWTERMITESLIVALNTHSFWGIRPIFISPPSNNQGILYPSDFPKDIVIFPFTNSSERLKAAKKEPIQLPDRMPNLSVGEIVLAVGFPGGERKVVSETVSGHPLAHVFGTVRGVTENNIIIQDTKSTKDRGISFGGMSGGPIFKIIDEASLSYKLVGIVYEGRGFIDTDEHGNSHCSDDIWIFGSPLDGVRLREMLRFPELNQG